MSRIERPPRPDAAIEGTGPGTVLANVLLALGVAFLPGGRRHHVMEHNPAGARTYASAGAAWALAVIGGAAESGSAIAMGRRGKPDLAVGIAMGSSIQIALFVTPVLALPSDVVAPAPLDLAFSRLEIGTLLVGTLIVVTTSGEGRRPGSSASSCSLRLGRGRARRDAPGVDLLKLNLSGDLGTSTCRPSRRR